ncbi:hypothetical protein SAMN04488582_102488 [Mycobacterium sp. 455mf]|nr:hypothetical protein SAMN04488582_102488 [Mycobacterium sp. 455mf]
MTDSTDSTDTPDQHYQPDQSGMYELEFPAPRCPPRMAVARY